MLPRSATFIVARLPSGQVLVDVHATCLRGCSKSIVSPCFSLENLAQETSQRRVHSIMWTILMGTSGHLCLDVTCADMYTV